MYVSQTQSIKTKQLTKNFKVSNRFELASAHVFLPSTGDSQHHDSEHITETGNENHTGMAIKLYIAIAIIS